MVWMPNLSTRRKNRVQALPHSVVSVGSGPVSLSCAWEARVRCTAFPCRKRSGRYSNPFQTRGRMTTMRILIAAAWVLLFVPPGWIRVSGDLVFSGRRRGVVRATASAESADIGSLLPGKAAELLGFVPLGTGSASKTRPTRSSRNADRDFRSDVARAFRIDVGDVGLAWGSW
jgi:hypothetical protein